MARQKITLGAGKKSAAGDFFKQPVAALICHPGFEFLDPKYIYAK
jgi:hypothetical protein